MLSALPTVLPSATARHALAQAVVPVTERPPRVLLAEDDARMRALVAEALRADGYDVVTVQSGAQLRTLLEHLQRHLPDALPDLVVSDVRLPGQSGLEVLAWMRDELPSELPVILITAFGDLETHEEALRLGAFLLLDKPFDMDDLRYAVHVAAEPL